MNKSLENPLDLPPEERSSFLKQACAGGEKLLPEIEEMLEARRHVGSFLGSRQQSGCD